MDSQNLPRITSAVAPVVMVSAAGLLFLGIQTKNLHLADRIRALTLEYRTLGSTADEPERREQIAQQLRLFDTRIRFSQHALELLYIAILCFVVTSLLLASAAWLAGWVLTAFIAAIFILGVALLLTALIIEFLEMHVGLRTIRIENRGRSPRTPSERHPLTCCVLDATTRRPSTPRFVPDAARSSPSSAFSAGRQTPLITTSARSAGNRWLGLLLTGQ